MLLVKENDLRYKVVIISLVFMISIIPLIYIPYTGNVDLIRISFKKYVFINQDNIYKPKIDTLLISELFLLVFTLYLLKADKLSFKVRSYHLPLSVFYLLLVLSTIFSEYKWTAVYGRIYRWEGLLAYTAYIFLFLFVSIFISNFMSLKIIFKSILASGVVVSCYGLIQLFNMDFIKRDLTRVNWEIRVFSTFGNPNFAGSYISMLLPIVVILFLHSESNKTFIYTGLLSSIYYSFLVATSTRSAWLTFFIILSILCWVYKNKIKENYRKVFILLLVFVCITILIDYYQSGYISSRFLSILFDINNLVDESNANKVGSNRIFIYRKSIPLLFKNPIFGSGLDTFAEVFPQTEYIKFIGRKQLVDKAHCEYLQLAITAGLPALLAYFCFLGSIVKEGYRNFRKNNKYQQALFMAMLAYLIQATFNISVVAVAPLFWAIMGMNVVINYIPIEEND